MSRCTNIYRTVEAAAAAESLKMPQGGRGRRRQGAIGVGAHAPQTLYGLIF